MDMDEMVIHDVSIPFHKQAQKQRKKKQKQAQRQRKKKHNENVNEKGVRAYPYPKRNQIIKEKSTCSVDPIYDSISSSPVPIPIPMCPNQRISHPIQHKRSNNLNSHLNPRIRHTQSRTNTPRTRRTREYMILSPTRFC